MERIFTTASLWLALALLSPIIACRLRISYGDVVWVRRFRTLTAGFMTPFHFLRAGSLVTLPALAAAPVVFLC